MQEIKNCFNEAKKNPALPWVIAFILLHLIARSAGGTNQGARFATMRSMVETASFNINHHKDMTMDWSRTPDGNYFANKAPGPMLLGFPLFYVLDKVTLLGEKNKSIGIGKRRHPGPAHAIVLSFFMQLLPFALLVLFVIHVLKKKWKIPNTALHFATLALLFGNTSSIFMSTYFGHGMAAMFILAMVLALIERNYYLTGFFYGFALLSEYAMAMVFIPLFIAIIFRNRKDFKWIVPCLLGGIIPGILWTWYHWTSFGGPFLTAIQFENPLFHDMSKVDNNLFGMFSPTPNWNVLFELLFGPSRGLLFTQPWILFLIPFSLWTIFQKKLSRDVSQLIVFTIVGIFLLLWMNSSFGGWHGGATSGPRYLCAFFPSFAVLVGFLYKDFSTLTRSFFWILLGISIVFTGLIYATTIQGDNAPLWPWLWNWLLNIEKQGKHWFRFALFFVVLIGVGYYSFKRKEVSGKRTSL